MKRLLLDPGIFFSIIRVRVLHLFVNSALASAPDSLLSAAINVSPVAASMRSVEPQRQKTLSWSIPEVVNYLFKKCASDPAIDGRDSGVLHYTQPAKFSVNQSAGNLYATSGEFVAIYSESTLKDTFTEEGSFTFFTVSNSIRQRVRRLTLPESLFGRSRL